MTKTITQLTKCKPKFTILTFRCGSITKSGNSSDGETSVLIVGEIKFFGGKKKIALGISYLVT